MGDISIKSKNAKAFYASREEAFRLLFTMIMSNQNTKFWFGATWDGDVTLYINEGIEGEKSIEQYSCSPDSKNIFNDKFFSLSDNQQSKKLEEYFENPRNIHHRFMRDFGDQAKKFFYRSEEA